MADLVRLRKENANEKFRKSLADQLKELAEADEKNINQVAADVARATATLIADHSRDADRLWQEYKKKLVLDGAVVIGAIVITDGIALYPWLAGLLGLAPGLTGLTGGIGKMLTNYINYSSDKFMLSQSVMGILSAAKELDR
jgi:predicted exporter